MITEPISVLEAITGASALVANDALPIITAAISLSVIFWAAKILWTKFKGLAK